MNRKAYAITICLLMLLVIGSVSAQYDEDLLDSCETGGDIVFVSDRNGDSEIYRMDSNGENIINLTQDPARDYSPRWSPDGTQIAFASDRNGASDIYVMNADGSNVYRLTYNAEYGDEFPIWSPDGRQIAYTSYPNGSGNINVMNADGSDARAYITTDRVGYASAWSPDGEAFAYELQVNDTFEIFVTTDTVNFTDGVQISPGDNNGHEFGFNWSPDGKVALFNYAVGGGSLYRMRINEDDYRFENNSISLVTELADNGSVPSWSPDGEQIVFSAANGNADDIYVIDAEGTNSINLTPNTPSQDFYPDWRPCVPISADA